MSHPPRIVPVLLTSLALVAGLAPARQGARADGVQELNATFNPDGSMQLSLADGTPVGTPNPPGTVIPAGPYLVVVNNNDSAQNFGDTHKFHLTGPGVDVEAVLTQEEEVQATWTVTFQPNATYVFQDDYRPTLIHLVFRASSSLPSVPAPSVGSSSPQPASGGSTTSTKNPSVVGSAIPPDPFRGSLVGAVSASGAVTLKAKGRNVSTLKAGRYKLVVTDRSAKSGFTIQEIRKAATTVSGAGFTGKRTITLHLKPGQWFFYPSFVGKKTYFIVIA
jgi:hypothetical protein